MASDGIHQVRCVYKIVENLSAFIDSENGFGVKNRRQRGGASGEGVEELKGVRGDGENWLVQVWICGRRVHCVCVCVCMEALLLVHISYRGGRMLTIF